jgi:hypothetical protein
MAPFRAYDPGLGRWCSEDPLGIEGGFNLYAYVSNGVVVSIDPLGLFRWSTFLQGAAMTVLGIVGVVTAIPAAPAIISLWAITGAALA